MRSYNQSDIFTQMNAGNNIINQLGISLKAMNENTVVNKRMLDSLNAMYRAYKDGVTLKVIDAVKSYDIFITILPIDKRLPANMPYAKIKRNGKTSVLVDISKYANVIRTDTGDIESIDMDIPKLYNLLIPAFIALNVLNDKTVVSLETTKWMSYLWAKMFNRILMTQKIFVSNQERYEAFMYFAMRFFMIYYMQTNLAIVDRISNEFIKNAKSQYILMIENNLKQKNIDLYADWNTFAYNMFSNEMTNIKTGTNIDMNIEQYIRLFCNFLGRDGAYLALWSADYFFYCIFATYNHAWLLNDRAWSAIVEDNPKAMPRIINGLYREL